VGAVEVAIVVIAFMKNASVSKKAKTYWFWIKRHLSGGHSILFSEMYDHDTIDHKPFCHNFWMTATKFDFLLSKVDTVIEKFVER